MSQVEPLFSQMAWLVQELAFLGVLAWVSVIDIKRYQIPNSALALATVIRLVYLWVFTYPLKVGYYAVSALVVVAALIIFGMLAKLLVKNASMGAGDVKLLGVCTLMVGLQQMFMVLLFSCVFGVLWAKLVEPRLNRFIKTPRSSRYFPWAPAISAAAIVTQLLGPRLVSMLMG